MTISDLQPGLFRPDGPHPEGFRYVPDFLSVAEEAEFLDRLAGLTFEPFQFHGYEGRRRVMSFGWRYDFTGAGLVAAEPIPHWLLGLRARAAALADVPTDAFAHVLINEYREGAPIGWHRDRPAFDRVVGISLKSPTTLRFRRREGTRWLRLSARLAARSAYLLDGPARTTWEHSIAEAKAHRFSITFRNLRAGP